MDISSQIGGPRSEGRASGRVWRACGICCCGLLMAFSGCAAPAFPNQLTATEKMMWSTYPLATKKGMASGFVVADGSRNHAPVLVTSMHVLKTVGRSPLLIGTRQIGKDGVPQVSLIQVQAPPGKSFFYVCHPQCDLAAFALDIPAQAAGLVQLPSYIRPGMIARNRQDVRPGTEVCFLGYPEVLPGTDGAFPILRSGKVASYSPGRIGEGRKFLINTDVYPGDSGAPVFINDGSKPKLAGVIIQRICKNARDSSHLAIAVDATVIRETLDLLQASRRE